MRSSARTRMALGVLLATAVAIVGLAGCARVNGRAGSGDANAANAADVTELSWDAQALESIGFSPDEMVPVAALSDSATPSPQAGDKARMLRKFKRLRFAFSKNVLHGEATIQTDEGVKTVVVQRGTVTAIDSTSITVKSSDGFTLTWTFGNPIHVIEHRTTVQPNSVKVGETVGVAGAKDGSGTVARLILIPTAK
jgi:hypothetical protein